MEHKCSKEQIIEELKKITYAQDTKIAVLESNVDAVKKDIVDMKSDIKSMRGKTNYILVSVILLLIVAIVNIFIFINMGGSVNQ